MTETALECQTSTAQYRMLNGKLALCVKKSVVENRGCPLQFVTNQLRMF